MKIMGLDIAGKTGFSVFETKHPLSYIDSFLDWKLVSYGVTEHWNTPFTKNIPSGPNHPYDLFDIVEKQVEEIIEEIIDSEDPEPNILVIEQTNIGNNRFQQKYLEWLHHELCRKLRLRSTPKIVYIDTSEWRNLLNVKVDKECKKHNKAVREKKAKGKITSKHVAVNYVNKKYSLQLKYNQDDIADAILLGEAYIKILEIGEPEYRQRRAEQKVISMANRKEKLARRKLKKEKK